MIRKPHHSEMDILKSLADKFFKATVFAEFKFDQEGLHFIIESAMMDDQGFIFLICDEGKGIETEGGFITGALLAQIGEYPWSYQSFATDIAMVSLVPHLGVGEQLLNEYKKECAARNCLPRVGVFAGINNPASHYLLEKCGFEEQGRTFIARV